MCCTKIKIEEYFSKDYSQTNREPQIHSKQRSSQKIKQKGPRNAPRLQASSNLQISYTINFTIKNCKFERKAESKSLYEDIGLKYELTPVLFQSLLESQPS